jgi:hypothetical protein
MLDELLTSPLLTTDEKDFVYAAQEAVFDTPIAELEGADASGEEATVDLADEGVGFLRAGQDGEDGND